MVVDCLPGYATLPDRPARWGMPVRILPLCPPHTISMFQPIQFIPSPIPSLNLGRLVGSCCRDSGPDLNPARNLLFYTSDGTSSTTESTYYCSDIAR